MMRGIALALVLLLSPGLVSAVTVEGQKNLVLSETPPDNAYLAGLEVHIDAPVQADLSAAGGSVNVGAPVAGDALIAGGTLNIDAPVGSDLRALGGRVTINGNVGGDLVAFGGVVIAGGSARDMQLYGSTVRVTGGATGNVKIYGGDVYLSGNYAGDVEVIASERVTLGEGTYITGAFKYNAPQEAGLPDSAVINGGVVYTGAATNLPSAEEARRFAVAGAGVFFLVKLAAAVIAAGLVAGLFPSFSNRVVKEALSHSPRRFLMSSLLGLVLIVATPLLLLCLILSFVGIGIAMLLGALYLFMLVLAFLYAGFISGATLLSVVFKKRYTVWKEAVLGMIVLYVLGAIPFLGGLVVFVLTAASAGIIARIAYGFAFNGASKDL